MNVFQTGPLVRAIFLNRPSRFTIQFRKGSEADFASLANPARLEEILLPGVTVLLAPRRRGRPQWEVMGASWEKRWPGDTSRLIFLNETVVSSIAARLIEQQLIPEIQGYRIVRKHVKVGNSHADMLLSNGLQSYLLGVKSVISCEERLAYYPDSNTQCAVDQLNALANNSFRYRTGFLFLVQGSADRFLPDFQNNLGFARTFLSLANRFDALTYNLTPVLTADEEITFPENSRPLTIPWHILRRGTDDGGIYLLLLKLTRDKRIDVGVRARLRFAAGWYIYVGSAKRHLSQRLDRHLHLRKHLHWHIDYLRAVSPKAIAFPIRGTRLTECFLAQEIQKIGEGCVDGFGCSDCQCHSHLFYFSNPPISKPSFHKLLTHVRRQILD